MNSLLIYNTNTAPTLVTEFSQTLGKIYKFQIGKQELLNLKFSIDEKIDSILTNEITNSPYDCILIPFSLSDDNYAEFLGLRFALHIRLTQSFRNIQTPIIFYGLESVYEINKLSDLGDILFTKEIYITNKITVSDFRNQIDYVLEHYKAVDENIFIKRFTERVQIKPSGSYTNHHSISNEWSIYRWASAIKVDNAQIKNIQKTIGSNIYFKYLRLKFPYNETLTIPDISIKKGKILLIDDEVDKGWDSVFSRICFNKNYELSRFKSIGANFKNLNPSEIHELVIHEVKTFNPDLIILDFRLNDVDFDLYEPKNVTGYKILKKIKDINPGIQVIVLSATNKIWNLLELQSAGADSFILKESPELSREKDYTINSIIKTHETINLALDRVYLKSFYTDIKVLESKIYIFKNGNEIINQLNVFWSLLSKAKTETEFAYSYITLNMIFEIINKEYLFINNENEWEIKGVGPLLDWKWNIDLNRFQNTNTYVLKDKSSEIQKIAGIIFQKLNLTDHDFINSMGIMIRKRNGFIHNDIEILNKQDLNRNYINRDIFEPKASKTLFTIIQKYLNLLISG